MSDEKQSQIQDVLKPLDADSKRFQELQKLWNDSVTKRKDSANAQPGDVQNLEKLDINTFRPIDAEMREIVKRNRAKGGVVDIFGNVIKKTNDIKVTSIKTGNPAGLINQMKNLTPKKKQKTPPQFMSQPVTVEEKETAAVSVTLGPQFKDPITGGTINPDNVAVDKIAAGEVAPVNSSLGVNAEMPNNRPEEPIADNVASMPAQANAVELNDAGLLNVEAEQVVAEDVKVPAPQEKGLGGFLISQFTLPQHVYTGAGTPIVQNIFNEPEEKVRPFNGLDQIAMIHDLEYQLATDVVDIVNADRAMITSIDLLLSDRASELGAREIGELQAARLALKTKQTLEGGGDAMTPVNYEKNKEYLEANPSVAKSMRGIISYYDREGQFDILNKDERDAFLTFIRRAFKPEGPINVLQQEKPALQDVRRDVPALAPERSADAKQGLEGKMEEFEEPSEEFFDVSEEKELIDAPESQFEEFKKFMDNKQRMDINERDYQDFLRNKQIKEQRIQELNKRERGLPTWLRPEFQKIYDQLDQLAYYSSAEFTEQENQLRYDQDRIRRGQSEQTNMSEQGLNIANNIAEREMKVRFNLPLDKPLWSAPTRGGLSVIPQDNYRVGYSRPYNREGEHSFIQNTRNGVGLYNSSFPEPINNLRRNYSMPPMRAQVHQMPRNPIDRDQFRHVRMMDRTPQGTATVLNDDFDGLNYKDDRRRDFEGRGMSLGERLQFEMFHMNN